MIANCKIHINTALVRDECQRCLGNGYTDWDLEEMENPIAFHNDGLCFVCKGSGEGFLVCPDCENEAYEELERYY